jgi:osmotically-inducible protein OsmY
LYPVMKRVGCAQLAVAVLCGVVACATPRTDAQREADKQTAARVQSALDADKELYAKHIVVRAYDGVVRLSGYVWEPSDMNEAVQTAELVPGVTKVVNNLDLQLNGIDDSSTTR